MARQIWIVALIFFAVITISSAASNAPAASPNVAEGPVDNSVIGTLDGTVGGAAPVGGPVPEGAFANLSPESPSSGATTTVATPHFFAITTIVIFVFITGPFFS